MSLYQAKHQLSPVQALQSSLNLFGFLADFLNRTVRLFHFFNHLMRVAHDAVDTCHDHILTPRITLWILSLYIRYMLVAPLTKTI